MTVRRALFIGFLLTFAQLAFALVVQGKPLGKAYLGLSEWDGNHYVTLGEEGYWSRIPRGDLPENYEVVMGRDTTVAFFPGYVFAGRMMSWLGIPMRVAFLLAAQIAAVGFWAYLLMLMTRWNLSRRVRTIIVALIATYPASFFLVSAYSESLTFAMLFGFLYWLDRDTKTSTALAIVHGFVLTATRITMLPVALLPLLMTFFKREKTRADWQQSALIAIGSLLGAASFFAYCAWAFGHWNLYMIAQEGGWGVRPDYLFFATHPLLTFFGWQTDVWERATLASRIAVAVAAWWLILASLRSRHDLLPLFIVAFGMFFFSAVGLTSVGMRSMVRYALPVMILLALVEALRSRETPAASTMKKTVGAVVLAAWLVVSLVYQGVFVRRFVDAIFVASAQSPSPSVPA